VRDFKFPFSEARIEGGPERLPALFCCLDISSSCSGAEIVAETTFGSKPTATSLEEKIANLRLSFSGVSLQGAILVNS
jgi:hypothetical protein